MPTDLAKPGLALRAMSANVSVAAGIVRAADIAANAGTCEIAVKPKSLVDQLSVPCCVSCALSAGMETLNARYPPLAPLFHYHVTRFDHSACDASGNLFLSDGLSTLTDDGVCALQLHNPPFTEQGAEARPAAEAYADAKTRALASANTQPHYAQSEGPSRVAWARQQLRQNRPVVIAFLLPTAYPDKFLADPKERFGWVDPGKYEVGANGHCVLAFGYDDGRQCLHIQDSQGRDRFDQGCWWMGYRVVDGAMVQDVYCLLP